MKYNKIISLIKEIYRVCFPHHRLKNYTNYQLSKSALAENKNLLSHSKRWKGKIESCVWFLPQFANIHAGGAVTIFKIAQKLSVKNNCVNYFIFANEVSGDWNVILNDFYPGLNYEIIISNFVTDINLDNVPSSDVGVCTFWTTALALVNYNKCKKKFYLLQDDERLFYASGSYSSLVEATYSFGFYGITNSSAIKGMYEKRCSAPVHHYVPGINKNFLQIKDYASNQREIKIVVYGRPSHSRNAFEILSSVLSSIAEELSFVKINFVGEDFDAKRYRLSPRINVNGNIVDSDDLYSLYDDCDIGICLITTPTISYQQLDILASGRCLVAVKNGEIENLFGENEICFVSPFYQIMKDELRDLISDRERIKEYAFNGREAVVRLDWDSSLADIVSFMDDV